MITLTKEQLIASAHARIEFAEMMLSGELEPLKERTWSIELELARIALASLEAEPVEWRVAFRLDGQPGSDFEKTFENQAKMNDVISLHEHAGFSASITPLYTAPPAPVSVPDFGALTKCIVQRLVDYGAADDDAIASAEEFVYNACRAAMLQGAEPVSNRDELPDGWVACSERLPDNKPGSYEYLVVESLNNGVHHDYWNVPDVGDDCQFTPFWNHYDRQVTHWMPLPAAPQQAVK